MGTEKQTRKANQSRTQKTESKTQKKMNQSIQRTGGCPDFVCLGFQKSGTTTLFEILKQHPDVVLCRDVKEPMFYRVPGFIQTVFQGQRFYQWRYFGHVDADDPRLRGEINAGLTFSACEKKMAKDLNPHAKLLFMMRDPVDRTYSAYKYFLARGFLPKKVVEDDLSSCHAEAFNRYVFDVLGSSRKRRQIMDKRMKYLIFSQSNYAACVREYMKDFPLENMHFIFFEEFIADQHQVCQELYDFLGITDPEGIDYHVKANEGKERPVSANAAKRFQIAKAIYQYALYEFGAMPRWAPNAYSHVKNHYRRVRAACLTKDEDKSKMLPQTREILTDYYRDDVKDLAKITGKDLGKIWKF